MIVILQSNHMIFVNHKYKYIYTKILWDVSYLILKFIIIYKEKQKSN